MFQNKLNEKKSCICATVRHATFTSEFYFELFPLPCLLKMSLLLKHKNRVK